LAEGEVYLVSRYTVVTEYPPLHRCTAAPLHRYGGAQKGTAQPFPAPTSRCSRRAAWVRNLYWEKT